MDLNFNPGLNLLTLSIFHRFFIDFSTLNTIISTCKVIWGLASSNEIIVK